MATQKTTSLKLDAALKARVNDLGIARNRSPHWLMVEAIREFVEREERRERFRQDAMHAWQDFQQTGLHATAEEADNWLADLERGLEAESPQCHR